MSKRQYFTKEFKIEAVRLLDQSDRPASEVARELGIRRNQLYKWRHALEKRGVDAAFRGPGWNAASENRSETTELKRRIAQLEEENAILKKAAAYFAKELP